MKAFVLCCGLVVLGVWQVRADAETTSNRDHHVERCALSAPHLQEANLHYGFVPNAGDIYIFLGDYFSCEGEITSLNLYAFELGTVFFDIWRLDTRYGTVTLQKTFALTVDTLGYEEYNVPAGSEMFVEPGDMLGIHYGPGSFNNPTRHAVIRFSETVDGCSSVMLISGDKAKYLKHGYHVYKTVLAGKAYVPSVKATVTGMTSYLRLVDGHDSQSGCAEIFREDTWGTVCDQWVSHRGWPYLFCEELGYPTCCRAGQPDKCDPDNTNVDKNVHLIDPNCKPSENTSMFHCKRHNHQDCFRSHYNTYLECAPRSNFRKNVMRTIGQIHLDPFLCNDNIREGIAMYYKDDRWGYICDNKTDINILKTDEKTWPHAFCRERGYPGLEDVVRLLPGTEYAGEKVPTKEEDHYHLRITWHNAMCNPADVPADAVAKCIQEGSHCEDTSLTYIKCLEKQ